MLIAVLGGAGAMGGIFGGWLQRSGSDVVLVDVSKDSVCAINGALQSRYLAATTV